jgi:hypothetical protein
MEVEVRDDVPVDLVVHLHRLVEGGEGAGDDERVLPERGTLLRGQLVRLDDVALADDAGVAGERSRGGSRHPRGA